MWASVIHEKNEGKAIGHGREKSKSPSGIYIYMIHFFRAHMFTFSSSNKESHDTRSNKKYLDRTTNKKFHTLAHLNQGV